MLKITHPPPQKKIPKQHPSKQNNPQTKSPYTHNSMHYSKNKRKIVDNDTLKKLPYFCKQLVSSSLSDLAWIEPFSSVTQS